MLTDPSSEQSMFVWTHFEGGKFEEHEIQMLGSNVNGAFLPSVKKRKDKASRGIPKVVQFLHLSTLEDSLQNDSILLVTKDLLIL